MDFATFTMPLLGGLLIGLAAALLLLFNGRIAGISGIMGGMLTPQAGDMGWRASMVGGLLAGGLLLLLLLPSAFPTASVRPLPLVMVGGLLVGFGTRLGSGCTSGHGVCGMGRLSVRSLAATLTFILTGAVTVLITRLLS